MFVPPTLVTDAQKLVNMNIGIFGDSFADKSTTKNIWWKYLNSEYNHKIECFGENGSSILFSANQILEHYTSYEFIIWCLTNPPRITIYHQNNAVHLTGRHHQHVKDIELQEKVNITEQFLNKVADIESQELNGHCIAEYVKSKVSNMLVVPTFQTKYIGKEFNLFELCQQESFAYFPNKSVDVIYDDYEDLRAGHFTDSTHKILAELISKSLQPGIFTANYSDFPPPTESFETVFRRKNYDTVRQR